MTHPTATVRMFDLDFNAMTLPEATDAVMDAAVARQKGLVVTPNVDHIVTLKDRPDLLPIYQRALFRFADGVPVVWASRFLSKPGLPERVAGSDLIITTTAAAGNLGLRLFLLGGEPGVTEIAATQLLNRYPDLELVGAYCPPHGFEYDPDENERIVSMVNAVRPHLLYIGVGSPKQERWADAHLAALDTGPILCIGVAFEFLIGKQRRAPKIAQKLGMEWAWRLMREPRRLWRRYLVRDPQFARIAWEERGHQSVP